MIHQDEALRLIRHELKDGALRRQRQLLVDRSFVSAFISLSIYPYLSIYHVRGRAGAGAKARKYGRTGNSKQSDQREGDEHDLVEMIPAWGQAADEVDGPEHRVEPQCPPGPPFPTAEGDDRNQPTEHATSGHLGCGRHARHRRFPSRSIAGSGVDRSWAVSSTSTKQQPEAAGQAPWQRSGTPQVRALLEMRDQPSAVAFLRVRRFGFASASTVSSTTGAAAGAAATAAFPRFS